MIDPQFLIAIFALFGMAVGAIAYRIGFGHGALDGHAKGLEEARGHWLPKVMQAKRDGAHTGRLTELRRQIDEAAQHN